MDVKAQEFVSRQADKTQNLIQRQSRPQFNKQQTEISEAMAKIKVKVACTITKSLGMA